ncbi:MAG: hypothetical protein K6D03_00265 [Solobacterium sp.]|nr:hypothetical protein [Solobacterium sp.]
MKRILNAAGAVIMAAAMTVSVHANSGLRFWEGTDSADVSSRNEDCPLTVEHESLVFEIRSLPDISSAVDGTGYDADVTAEYTFYNPGPEDVTANLVFPFGTIPHHINTGSLDSDLSRYNVLIDGQKTEARLRVTLNTGDFDIRKSLEVLKDEYIEDAFYRPDLPVTKYVISVTGTDSAYDSVCAAVFIADGNRKCFLQEGNGGGTGGTDYLIQQCEKGSEILLYVIGEPYSELPEIRFYENGSLEKQVSAEAELKEKESMTLEELVLDGYDSQSGVSAVDRYNAVISYLNRNSGGRIITEYYAGREFYSSELLRWFEYDMEVKAGQTVINTVTAPLYPSIDENYEPPVFTFTYLLSPAGTWASFRNLDVRVITDMYLFENKKFEKTDTGYAYSSETLPEGELTFSLCRESSRHHKNNWIVWMVLGAAAVCLLLFGLAVFLLIKLVLALLGRKRR